MPTKFLPELKLLELITHHNIIIINQLFKKPLPIQFLNQDVVNKSVHVVLESAHVALLNQPIMELETLVILLSKELETLLKELMME
jgi:hypothetical protein